MSAVTVESVKRDLRIMHDADDALLQELINAGEQSCLRFLDVAELPAAEYDSETSSELVYAEDVLYGIRLIVRSMYEETDPTRLAALRTAAETLWMPYRAGLGV